jgi:D-3-phosphoglycerate dehydrogenase
MEAEIVSIHLPYNESTKNLLDASMLRLMKKNSVLINTSRGGIVDEHELKILLKDNYLQGAAFDVFQVEPPQDLELLELDNFIATSHIGGSSKEAIEQMGLAAIAGLSY